jgi:hypothetical protein
LANLIAGEFGGGYATGQGLINGSRSGPFTGSGLNLKLIEVERAGDHRREDQDHEERQDQREFHCDYATVRRPPT